MSTGSSAVDFLLIVAFKRSIQSPPAGTRAAQGCLRPTLYARW